MDTTMAGGAPAISGAAISKNIKAIGQGAKENAFVKMLKWYFTTKDGMFMVIMIITVYLVGLLVNTLI